MPFFRSYVSDLDDASREKECRPSDFFACDILINEDGTLCPNEDSNLFELSPSVPPGKRPVALL
jgi:hypothetical protein